MLPAGWTQHGPAAWSARLLMQQLPQQPAGVALAVLWRPLEEHSAASAAAGRPAPLRQPLLQALMPQHLQE
jgi:hypothetical protein